MYHVLATEDLQETLKKALVSCYITMTDVVWRGDSGDYLIGNEYPIEYDEDDGLYVEAGIVEEYLD